MCSISSIAARGQVTMALDSITDGSSNLTELNVAVVWYYLSFEGDVRGNRYLTTDLDY